jgi:hypothetical protein
MSDNLKAASILAVALLLAGVAASVNLHDHLDPARHGDTVDLFQFLIEGDRPMSTTVWAAPAFRLKSRHVLRFLAEARSPIRAVEVRLFSSDTLYSDASRVATLGTCW